MYIKSTEKVYNKYTTSTHKVHKKYIKGTPKESTQKIFKN